MRVLLAVDGSAGAERAVALVEGVRWPAESVVRVVSVVEPTAILVGTPFVRGAAVPSPDIDAEIVAYQEEQVADVVRRVRTAGVQGEGSVVRGRPGTVLVDEARAIGADLVAVGSRGHGALASLVLGSVSSEVVDDAPCPVLVARAPRISRVVFASDGSAPSRAAEAVVAGWPIFEGIAIDVVSVADVSRGWSAGTPPAMYSRMVKAHEAELRTARDEHGGFAAEAAARLRDAGRPADAHTRSGDAAAEIVRIADELGADLIVIGSRGRTGLTRAVLGSVARNVLHGSQASVLVVHEPAASRQRTT